MKIAEIQSRCSGYKKEKSHLNSMFGLATLSLRVSLERISLQLDAESNRRRPHAIFDLIRVDHGSKYGNWSGNNYNIPQNYIST